MNQLIPPVNTNDHIYGSAALELVEYGDYECPYCGRAYPIIKHIQQKLGDDLKFVFRNFPLSHIHPHAFAAAVATEAAGLQNKFWEMHDIVFENQKTLEPGDIFYFAKSIGLDLEKFKNDITNNELQSKVEGDIESGFRSGVNKTPTFFINGVRYEGDWEENTFLQYLKDQLMETSISGE
jgi:protein-disulfide isomerase